MLKTLNALIVPTTGRVLIDGVDVASQAGPALRRAVRSRTARRSCCTPDPARTVCCTSTSTGTRCRST